MAGAAGALPPPFGFRLPLRFFFAFTSSVAGFGFGAGAAGPSCLKGHWVPCLQLPMAKNLQGTLMDPGAFLGWLDPADEFRLPPFASFPLFGLARCSYLHPCVEQAPVRQKEKHTP